MNKKYMVASLIICAIIALLVPNCLYHKIKLDEYKTISVQVFDYYPVIHYPEQFLDAKRIDEWLRYNQKQYYSINFPPIELRIHMIACNLRFDHSTKYRTFGFSEYENKVFYDCYNAHGLWGYARKMTDIDREFLQFLRLCVEEQEKSK